jgi:asparagine synthase (glutamine-hydrolysing)
MVWQLDEPLADPAPLNVLYISELARQQGIKVLLSGSAGDDLFTGYRRHRAVMLDRWWMAMPRSIRVGVEAWSRSLDQRRVTGRRLERLFRGAGLGRDDRLANYFVSLPHAQATRLFAPEVRRSMEELVPAQPLIDFLSPLPESASSLQRMLAIEQRFFLADHNLTYTDKMSMAVGVEARVPFLDLELVEFAARIPDGLKQRGAVGKWVLKKAMEPFLPHDVIYRPKTGFGAPIRRWMVGELRPVLDGLLSTEAIRRRGLFDAEAVRALIEANAAGSVDGSYTLLSLLCIEMWCRRFLDA